MPNLTATGWTVLALAVALVILAIGWTSGRAYQRAVDAWWRFRSHVRSTRYMFLSARAAAFDALGTVALAALVLVAAIVTAWMLLT